MSTPDSTTDTPETEPDAAQADATQGTRSAAPSGGKKPWWKRLLGRG